MYCVIILIRQPVIGPPFRIILSFPGLGASPSASPATPLWLTDEKKSSVFELCRDNFVLVHQPHFGRRAFACARITLFTLMFTSDNLFTRMSPLTEYVDASKHSGGNGTTETMFENVTSVV